VSIIRGTRIDELGTISAVTSNRSTLLVNVKVVPTFPILATLMTEAKCSSKISVVKRATRRNVPEDSILQIQGNKIRYISKAKMATLTNKHIQRYAISYRSEAEV
jgi:hypothetical protein